MSRVGKQDLAKLVAKRTGVPDKTALRVVAEVFDSIASELAKGQTVSIKGFGTWRTKICSPRTGHNPRDGSPLDIPARTRVAFKPGTSLREAVETSIEPEVFFGDGVARGTAIESVLTHVFDFDAVDVDLERVRERIRELLGPAAEREAEEFFKGLVPGEQEPADPHGARP